MQLDGKTIIVTGGGRGLGRAYSEALAAEGAAVVAADIRDTADTVTAIEGAGYKAIGLDLNVADMDSCQAVADRTVAEFGRIDALINNAALYGDISGGRFNQIPEDQWDRVMMVNVKGIWQCCKACVPAMREAGGGLVINVASMAAFRPSGMAGSAYSASKAAMRALSININDEEWRNGIRATTIHPGETDTPILDLRPEPPSAAERAHMVQAEDIAAAVIFVAQLPARARVDELLMTPTHDRRG